MNDRTLGTCDTHRNIESPGVLRIRLLGTIKPENWFDQRVTFDPAVPQNVCDGMLCWGACNNELLGYKGPRAWYFPEPRRFSMRRALHFHRALRELREHEFLHHSNPNPKFRIPCITHYGPITLATHHRSKRGIVAIVSNFGGRLRYFKPEARLRNEFILHEEVELYGSLGAWKRFRSKPWSRIGLPKNYVREWPSTWYFPAHVEELAKYRIAICLENSYEANYFTEKFVNAARAGCVPVYHAHPTVRDSVLKGAKWIDPADYSFDVCATLRAAKECESDAIVEQNYEWLKGDAVSETDGYRIWSRVAEIFVERQGCKKLDYCF
jgi:hypothetical protein